MTVHEAIKDLKLCDDLSDFLAEAAERNSSEPDGVVVISTERAAELALALQHYAKVLKSANLELMK